MGKFIETTKEASVGGFAGILAVRGLLVDLDLVAPPEGWETTKDQMKASLEDAVILEMREGEDEFELNEGKFSCMWPYADKGKTPHKNGIWMRTAVASAEAMKKRPSQFVGEVITLRKIPTPLFKQPVLEEDPNSGRKKPVLDDEGKKVYEEVVVDNYFCFVPDEAADSDNVKEHIRDILDGLTDKAALRKLMIDQKAKQFPEFKDTLKESPEKLAKELDLLFEDGKFMKVEDEDTGQD
jgi:hypothetical protein